MRSFFYLFGPVIEGTLFPEPEAPSLTPEADVSKTVHSKK